MVVEKEISTSGVYLRQDHIERLIEYRSKNHLGSVSIGLNIKVVLQTILTDRQSKFIALYLDEVAMVMVYVFYLQTPGIKHPRQIQQSEYKEKALYIDKLQQGCSK